MARRRPLFARTRRAARRFYVGARRATRRMRRRGRAHPRMGIVGMVGAGLALVPIAIAALGNGGKLPGAINVWRTTGNAHTAALEFVQTLSQQYVGVLLDGRPADADVAYTGWKWLAYGGGLMLGDAIAGRIARRMGVRAPRLPLVGRPISG